MIHHTYISSISLRTSFSSNDYTYCSNERCPSSYCSLCCSFSINSPRFIVPINPSFLYGLRQSTLIQWPPSRRLILGSGDRYGFRTPVSDVGRCCHGECCCVKRERADRVLGKCCKEKCCVKKMNFDVSVNKIRGRICRRDYQCSAIGDAEAMLSLLTEETFEECLDVRERRRSLSKDGNIIRKQNVVCEGSKGRKEDLGSGYLGGRLSRCRLELGKIKSKDEVSERSAEREVLLKEEERRSRRKESSSGNLGGRLDMVQAVSNKLRDREEDYMRRAEREDCAKEEEHWSRRHESSSSYYSASDTSDLESDTEVEIQDERYVGEASTRHEKDSRQFGSVVISEENKTESRRYKDERDQLLQSGVHVDSRVGSSAVPDSRKQWEGIVLSEEIKKDSKRHVDETNQQLRASGHDDSRVASSTEWDWRKKSEKRLTEESAQETKARKESVVTHSQMSQAHESSALKASRSEKQFDYQEEGSSSSVSSHGLLRSHVKKDHHVSGYSKSSSRHEQSTQTARHNVEITSNMQRRSNQWENGMMVVGQSLQETDCEYCKSCGRTMQQSKTKTALQQSSELSQIRDDVRSTSTVQGQSKSRLEKQKSSLQTLVQQKNEQHDQMTHMVAGQVQTSRKLQHYSEAVDARDNYVESSSNSRQQSETHMKTFEENSSLRISRQEVKGPLEKSDGKVIKETKSSSVAQTAISSSQANSNNVKVNHQSASQQHIYNEQIYSTKVKSEAELIQKHKYIDETILRSKLRTEVERPIIEAVYTGNFSGEASASRPTTALISQTGIQQFSEGETDLALQISTLSPSVDSLSGSVRNDFGGIAQVGTGGVYVHPQARTSVADEVSSDIELYAEASREDAIGSAEHMEESSTHVVSGFVEGMRHEGSTSQVRTEGAPPQQDSKHQVGASSLHVHPQAQIPSSIDEVSGHRSESYEELSHGSALVSAECMEESAIQIVGKFVEKMQHEASTLQGTKMKKSSQLDSMHRDEKHMLKGSSQSDSENAIIQKQESRRSSGTSETKGPSDEMWDAKDHFGQESSEAESSIGAISENVSVKRTGKSLWNVVAGMFRILHAETQNSSIKESGQSSSNESASGGAWSSEDEADDANGDSTKSVSLPEEPTPSVRPLQRKASTKNQREDFGGMILDDRKRLAEVGASSSLSVLQTGSPSGGVSSGVNTNWNITLEMSQPTPSDSLVPPAGGLGRSQGFEEIEEAGQSTGEQGVQSFDLRQTGLRPTSEVTDAEAKKRKLQRSNQVLNERYYEWENAYRREREQRKVDEIFMREALVEAKKAADSWEVPVGAVLVQNGNVIARGYNLVEELRDSTAHAEMICIREASNVLRTWRLSETTLYVTLEPCPMCAGAILQARVGTLVWGAPNRLLGADGSWIRLFSEGAEGDERPEVAGKPAAPLHPFHPNMKIRRGVLEAECADIMQQFFQLRRRKEKKLEESGHKPGLLHKVLKFPVIRKKRSS